MSVDEEDLQVIIDDIEVIMENCPVVLLYGIYLPVSSNPTTIQYELLV